MGEWAAVSNEDKVIPVPRTRVKYELEYRCDVVCLLFRSFLLVGVAEQEL